MIANAILDRAPQNIVLWGIGLTESDIDLISIYQSWSKSVDFIDVINPDPSVAKKVTGLLQKKVRHYAKIEEWVLAN